MVQAGKNRESSVKALIALGSNATSRHGDAAETVQSALRWLNRGGLRLVAQSRLFRTPFVPAGGGEDVINAAALVETDFAPGDLLEALHQIEAEFGRSREVRWGSRTLDLDLLMVDDLILPDIGTFEKWHSLPFPAQQVEAPDSLVLPHPRLAERAFVLVPAVEIAPDWPHPILGRTLADLLAALPEDEVDAVQALGG